MKTNQPMRRGFTLVELLVVIVIIAALAGLSAPMVIRQQKKAALTEATSNARQVGLALLEFDSEYGSFPDASTAKQITDAGLANGYTLAAATSNDCMLQLIALGYTKSEKMFWCKTRYTVGRPDEVITPGEALGAGEVGFGYMLNTADGLSTSSNPGCAVMVAPLGNNNGAPDIAKFDQAEYDGKAVLLKVDGSVEQARINPTDGLPTLGGQPLTTGGPNSVWGADITTPTILPPVAKP